jgi:short-subunit dehydrogenase
MRVRNAAVIITGASAGIGHETALEFARQGAHVVLAARREERLRELARRCEALGTALGVRALPVPTDIGRGEDVEALVRATLDAFGRVDVLVNNAGFGFSGTIEETTEADMRELMDVNYFGAFNAVRAVLPHMRAQRRGHIVNVSSVVGKMAFPYHGAYSSTKFALVALTEALRGELAGSGVTATVVLPGSTRTEFFDVQRTNDGHVSAPTGPQQDPDVVARAIVRSVRKPTPEVNMVRAYRLAYGLNGFFPVLRDVAGRIFYRTTRGRPRRL